MGRELNIQQLKVLYNKMLLKTGGTCTNQSDYDISKVSFKGEDACIKYNNGNEYIVFPKAFNLEMQKKQ